MGILDFIFRRTKTPITQPAGVSGVSAYGGMLVSFEQRPELQGRNLYLTLTNLIANTIVVGTGVRYYQNLLGGTSWSVEPKEGTGAQGQKAADLVKEGLFEASMPDQWSTCVKRASLYRMMGFSAHEWTMRKRKDGKLVYASIEHRPQSTVQFWDLPDNGGTLRGIVQRPILAGDYYYIQRERLWYCVDNSLTDSPDGVGILRHVVEHARRLSRYEQIEGYGYETDLRGIPAARIPYRKLQEYATQKGYGASWVQAQVAAMEKLVAEHVKTPWQGITMDSHPYTFDGGTNGGTAISTTPEWALELLKGDSTGLAEVHQVIERINREIARCMGMEFLLLGGDGKGSLALSRDKTSMFASNLESALHELAWFTVHDLVYPLLQLNGIDPEEYAPQVNPDPIATERIEVAVDALYKMAQAGAVIMPDDPVIDQIRSRLHLADQPKIAPELIGAMQRQAAGIPPEPTNDQGQGNDQGSSGSSSSSSGNADENGQPNKKPGTPATKSTFRQEQKAIEDWDDPTDTTDYASIDIDNLPEESKSFFAIAELAKMIRRENGKWAVYSSDGSRRMGRFDTREAAIAKLRLVEHFK